MISFDYDFTRNILYFSVDFRNFFSSNFSFLINIKLCLKMIFYFLLVQGTKLIQLRRFSISIAKIKTYCYLHDGNEFL